MKVLHDEKLTTTLFHAFGCRIPQMHRTSSGSVGGWSSRWSGSSAETGSVASSSQGDKVSNLDSLSEIGEYDEKGETLTAVPNDLRSFVTWFNELYDEASVEKMLEGIAVHLSGISKQLDKTAEKNTAKKTKNRKQREDKRVKTDQVVYKAAHETLEKCRHSIDTAVVPLSKLLRSAHIAYDARFCAGEKIFLNRAAGFLPEDEEDLAASSRALSLPKRGTKRDENLKKKTSRSPLQLFYSKGSPSRKKTALDRGDTLKAMHHPNTTAQSPLKRGTPMLRGLLVKSRDPWEQVCSVHLDVDI